MPSARSREEVPPLRGKAADHKGITQVCRANFTEIIEILEIIEIIEMGPIAIISIVAWPKYLK